MTKVEQKIDELQELLGDRYLESEFVTLKDYCYQRDILDLLRRTLDY